MSKCHLRVSIVSDQRPLSIDLIPAIGYDLDYTITDGYSVSENRVERSACIEFYKIDRDRLYEVWLNIYMFLKNKSHIPERHCAFLSWPATDFYGCVWEFYNSICPSKVRKLSLAKKP